MADTEIREGFLCPICLKDLGTVTQLQAHFEESHSSEDKAVFQSLKGLFDKAKKKILKAIEDEDEGADGGFSASVYTTTHVSGYDPGLWEPQELGQTRSHTDPFKAIRDARIDRYVIETNKLLIRLDKLIASDAPTEANKRKAFEKSVVPWIRDGDIPFCVSCGRQFTLMRRRHHCRLCGGIMCNRCSQFLPFSFARKLTNPAFTPEAESGFLRRSDSNSSLNSIMSPEGEPHLRTCDECRKLLERRDQLVELRNTKPTIVLLYEKMKSCLDESEQLLPRYNPMVESLCLGEATYAYFEAQKLRIQLLKLFEAVDLLSKKILNLGLDADELPTPKQAQLQKAIRAQASAFLQENMLTLQSLPSEEEYSRLQDIHKAKVQKRIAYERQQAMLAQEQERRKQGADEPGRPSVSSQSKDTKECGSGHKRNDSKDSVGMGWKPHEEVKRTVTRNADDPMIQQMDIIRGYIKQARQAMKFDEVHMLEQNLAELQQEYWRQQGAESFLS